ncbi:AAEL012050-PA [Aedes aegypti]|uniref:AAEL012050-PA n=1 Tax=Aedes aegypti TaxID=7159 RepID=Q16N89_AEDAE|nr:AAEL012050-PA [Aedes aegypti]
MLDGVLRESIRKVFRMKSHQWFSRIKRPDSQRRQLSSSTTNVQCTSFRSGSSKGFPHLYNEAADFVLRLPSLPVSGMWDKSFSLYPSIPFETSRQTEDLFIERNQ